MTIVWDKFYGFVERAQADAPVVKSVPVAKQAPVAEKIPVVKQTPVSFISQQAKTFLDDAPCCMVCGMITIPSGNCYLCHNCGTSQGCS